MTSKECELQLNQLIIDWDEDRETMLNATDIEAIKHLMLENQMQQDAIVETRKQLVEQENWLRACIVELMKTAEKDYYWIMNHQIESSKNITIGYSIAGNGDIQFYEMKEDNKEEVDEKNKDDEFIFMSYTD